MESGAASTLKNRFIRVWSIPIWALLGSVMLHALLLWPFGWHWRLPSWLGGRPQRMVVRVLAPPAQPARLSLVSPSPVDPATPLSPEKQPVTEMATATPAPTPASASASASAPAPTPTEQPVSTPSDDPDEGYLPSELLSRPATPVGDIELQSIASPETSGRLQLVLWINKAGEVVKVDIEVTEGPSWFTDQVIDRFQQTRFEPGLKDGQPVASLMRIEVSF